MLMAPPTIWRWPSSWTRVSAFLCPTTLYHSIGAYKKEILDCSIRAVQHRLIDVKKDYPWPAGMDKNGNVVGQSGVLRGSFEVTRKRKSTGNTTKAASGKAKATKKEPKFTTAAAPEPNAEADAEKENFSWVV